MDRRKQTRFSFRGGLALIAGWLLLAGGAWAQPAEAPAHVDRVYGWQAVMAGNGLLLMLVGIIVVFCALVTLVVLMKLLKWYQSKLHARIMAKQAAATGTEPEVEGDIPGVLVAAIAITIILEEESIHDEESMVLTLQALPKPYSNWWMRRMIDHEFARRQPATQTIQKTVDPIEGHRV